MYDYMIKKRDLLMANSVLLKLKNDLNLQACYKDIPRDHEVKNNYRLNNFLSILNLIYSNYNVAIPRDILCTEHTNFDICLFLKSFLLRNQF